MAAKRKRTEPDAAQGPKKKMAGPGSDDEFVDDDKEPTEAVAPDGSIIKLPQVRPALPAVSLRGMIADSVFFCLEQKKFYRQRAHANPLADHGFD